MIGVERQSCPYCLRIFNGKAILESKSAAVIQTDRPRSKGHCLIVPKQHVTSLFDMPNETTVEVWGLVNEIKKTLERELRPNGWNLRINLGEAAGQTVWHAHIHLVPRYDQENIRVEDL